MTAHMLSLLLLLLTTVGCGHRPYYGLDVMNRTGQRCSEIVIEFGGRSEEFPDMGPNGRAGIFGGFPNPSPSQSTVKWTTENGEHHAKTVKLKSLKGAALDKVDYVFVIRYDGSVEAAPLTLADQARGLDAELACAGRPAYVVGVKNLTDSKLTDVAVRFGEFQVNLNEIVLGPERNHGWSFALGLPYPVTDSAQIQWKTASGAEHFSEVALRPGLPADLNGICICFLLGDAQTASTRAVPFKELQTGLHPDLDPGWKVSSRTK